MVVAWSCDHNVPQSKGDRFLYNGFVMCVPGSVYVCGVLCFIQEPQRDSHRLPAGIHHSLHEGVAYEERESFIYCPFSSHRKNLNLNRSKENINYLSVLRHLLMYFHRLSQSRILFQNQALLKDIPGIFHPGVVPYNSQCIFWWLSIPSSISYLPLI